MVAKAGVCMRPLCGGHEEDHTLTTYLAVVLKGGHQAIIGSIEEALDKSVHGASEGRRRLA